MRVIICSDSHGRLEYFQKMMDIEKPDVVVFAGDHSTDAIDMSYVYPDVTFHIVRGNTDFIDYSTEDELMFELNGKKIYFNVLKSVANLLLRGDIIYNHIGMNAGIFYKPFMCLHSTTNYSRQK